MWRVRVTPEGNMVELEATHLRGNQWAVRPKGQLGTVGWHPVPWTVIYVFARCAAEAIAKANRMGG
jgi:hypothetical protein